MPGYKLALVEIYHPLIHGSQNSNFYSHFFYSLNVTVDEFMEDYPDGWINERFQTLNLAYTEGYGYLSHPIIENYRDILERKGCLSLEIIKPVVIMDNGCETYVCILKTFWLKCFQRKWKKYYTNKILKWKSPKVLYKRQIYGKYI